MSVCFGRLRQSLPWTSFAQSFASKASKHRPAARTKPVKAVKSAPVIGTEVWLIHKSYTRVRPLSSIPETDDVHLLTKEMRRYIGEYKRNGAEPFFHRKSGRVVLSLLHVEHEGKDQFVRGINSEVSLPTGSVCAERTAIGNARASFPNIIRKQMKGIAVLEVPLLNNWDADVNQDLLNPLPPCGACNEWLLKIGEENPGFYVVTFQDLSLDVVHERFQFWSKEESATAKKEMGAWTCTSCKHWNVPLSVICQGCKVHRFSASYLHLQKAIFFDVLQALEGGPLTAPELQSKMDIHKNKHTMNIKQMRTVLKKLGKRHAEVHPVVAKNQDGRYQLTETGRQALIQRKKLVKAQRPRHRRVE